MEVQRSLNDAGVPLLTFRRGGTATAGRRDTTELLRLLLSEDELLSLVELWTG